MNLKKGEEIRKKFSFSEKKIYINKFEDNNKEEIKKEIDKIKPYNQKIINEERNYKLEKLLSENLENYSSIKKINEIRDENFLKHFKSETLEIRNITEEERNKINENEKTIVNNNNIKNINYQKENDILTLSEITSTITRDLNESNDEISKLKKENIKLKQNINELNDKFNSIDFESILNFNNEKEKINNKLIEFSKENNQKNSIIKKLNDCIIEYNKTIIESKNEIFERDEQIEQLIKEKNELIEKNNILLNKLIQNTKDSEILNKKMKELINENERKNNEINSLSMIISNLQNENNLIQLNKKQENDKINNILFSYKQHQIEANKQILILTKNNTEKDQIINNLNQNIIFYKSKVQENQKKISNFFNILTEIKKYVFEVEKMISNKDLNLYNNEKKKNINEDLSIQQINNIDINTNEYNNFLLNSLKNMIGKIDSKLNDK